MSQQSGTTKEHALLARSLGVIQLIVVMNKMENVGFKEERYLEIKEMVSTYLKSIGFKAADTSFIPISALTDENVTRKATEPRLTSWYGTDQPCLLELLD